MSTNILCAKLHYMDTGCGHVVQHPCTNGRAHNNSTTCCTKIHHQRTEICHIPTSWHVEMLGSGIAMWQICCTTSCRIVVSSSVGGVVQHVRSRCPCSGVWHFYRCMHALLIRSNCYSHWAPIISRSTAHDWHLDGQNIFSRNQKKGSSGCQLSCTCVPH